MKTLFKIFLIVLFITGIYPSSSSAAPLENKISIKAYTFDRFTKQPLSYVEIGFLNRNTGVISNEDGYFELNFSRSNYSDEDILQFQIAGYYPIRLKLSLVKSFFSKNPVIFLTKKEYDAENKYLYDSELDVTTSFNDNSVDANFDFTSQKPTKYWSTSVLNGREIITSLNVFNGLNYDKAFFYLKLDGAEKIKARFKIYKDFNLSSTDPSNYIEVHKIVDSSGWHYLDFDELNYKPTSDTYIGIQVVDNYDSNFNLKIGVSDNTNSIEKSSSHSKPFTFPFNGIKFIPVLDNSIVSQNYFEGIKSSRNNGLIYGVVLHKGEPIDGVKINVVNKFIESETDENGVFSIKADSDDQLNLSHFSYKEMTVNVEENNTMNIELDNKYTELDQVNITKKKNLEVGLEREVYTGFGMKSKRSLGYAAYYKTVEDLNSTAFTFTELVEGRFPGLRVQRSQAAFSDQFFGRGGNAGGFGPGGVLVVVDGMPDQLNGQFLDVFEIASVTYVPGVQGVFRYGPQAAGGIMYVTTKTAVNNEYRKHGTFNEIIFSDSFKEEDFNTKVVQQSEEKTGEINVNYKEEFFKNLDVNRSNIEYYLNNFIKIKNIDIDFAKSILDTLQSEASNSIKALRSLAFYYEKNNFYSEALSTYKKIGSLKPYSVQNYLDLANAYMNLREYDNSTELYLNIIGNRIPGLVTDSSSKELAEVKLRHLLTKYKSFIDLSRIDSYYYNKAQVIDLMVVSTWNDVQSSFEIIYVNPNNKSFKSSHKTPDDVERFQLESKIGFNSEFVTFDNFKESDDWSIYVNSSQTIDNQKNPNYVKLTVYKNYGSTTESKKIILVDLNQIAGDVMEVSDFNL